MKTLFDEIQLYRERNNFYFIYENGGKERVSTADAIQWEISRKLNLILYNLDKVKYDEV